MLRGIHPLLTPELLHITRSMGHGDKIAIVDINFPGTSAATCTTSKKLVNLAGANAIEVGDAILSVLPLDCFLTEGGASVSTMQVVGSVDLITECQAEFKTIIDKHNPVIQHRMDSIERQGFYEAAKNTFAIVQCSERRP